MVNAWSLAASILDGTFDEDYPIMTDKKVDPDGGINTTNETGSDTYELSDLVKNLPKTDHTTFIDEYPPEYMYTSTEYSTTNVDASALTGMDGIETLTLNIEDHTKEIMTDSRNKYHEEEILNDIKEYVSRTYNGHYTGTKHEYRNVQTIDLMASRDLASHFCQANILKYGSRYGSKDGRNKKDLLKVIHYAMLLLHFDEHYGKPSMTSGNIDHTMP